MIWFDNWRRMKRNRNPLNPTHEINASAFALLHTTELPEFEGQPTLENLYARVPSEVASVLSVGDLMLARI